MDLTKNSYNSHIQNIEQYVNENIEEYFYPIINKNCISYQISERTLKLLSPFLKTHNTWLTIGDMNGMEANYLDNNNQTATASDISDEVLKKAFERNLIQNYSKVNVENIHYEDNKFDYVFCKEAFHHFPKAFLGLYEMLRVSKKATIIIEPIDILSKIPFLLLLKNFFDRFNPKLISKVWKNRFSFETVGNYVFKISEREIEKIAMGLGLRIIAFKGINIMLNLKTDKSIIKEVPSNSKHLKKIYSRIKFKNFLSRLHFLPYNHLCCVIFKEKPDNFVITEMKKMNFNILELPENPYLKK
jgi:ubiquinone/menaquinone biosynthesis C-methylase UbiE